MILSIYIASFLDVYGDILTNAITSGGEMVGSTTSKSGTIIVQQWRSNYYGSGKLTRV